MVTDLEGRVYQAKLRTRGNIEEEVNTETSLDRDACYLSITIRNITEAIRFDVNKKQFYNTYLSDQAKQFASIGYRLIKGKENNFILEEIATPTTTITKTSETEWKLTFPDKTSQAVIVPKNFELEVTTVKGTEVLAITGDIAYPPQTLEGIIVMEDYSTLGSLFEKYSLIISDDRTTLTIAPK